MEDRLTPFVYLELSDRPAAAYARERVAQVRALAGVARATWWMNQKPGRTDYRRTLDEFATLGVYEVDAGFAAPATNRWLAGVEGSGL